MSLMAVSLMEYFLSATHTLYQAGGATPSGDIGRTPLHRPVHGVSDPKAYAGGSSSKVTCSLRNGKNGSTIRSRCSVENCHVNRDEGAQETLGRKRPPKIATEAEVGRRARRRGWVGC